MEQHEAEAAVDGADADSADAETGVREHEREGGSIVASDPEIEASRINRIQKRWLYSSGARLDPQGTTTVLSTTPSGDCTIRLRVMPLPEPIREAMETHRALVSEMRGASGTEEMSGSAIDGGPEEDDSEPDSSARQSSTESGGATGDG